jgi:hypothetical protein
MILNTFIKKKNLTLTKSQKSWLGRNIMRCYKSKHPDTELKKVNISENGCKMSVVDYPRGFLETEAVGKILKRFMNKNVLKKEIL